MVRGGGRWEVVWRRGGEMGAGGWAVIGSWGLEVCG